MCLLLSHAFAGVEVLGLSMGPGGFCCQPPSASFTVDMGVLALHLAATQPRSDAASKHLRQP